VQEACWPSGWTVLPDFGRVNTWASIAYLHRLGWEFVGGEPVPWPSSLARGPHGWAQVATFLITGPLIVILAVAVRDQLPRRRASSFAVVLLAMLGVALILDAFRVDVPMLSGGSPASWHGWVHGFAFLLIIATGVLAPLTMALCPAWSTEGQQTPPAARGSLGGSGYAHWRRGQLISTTKGFDFTPELGSSTRRR
jgi:hypothetical protein